MHSLSIIKQSNVLASWHIFQEADYWVARHKYLRQESPRCASRADAEAWALIH